MVIYKYPFTNFYKYVRDEYKRQEQEYLEFYSFPVGIPELLIPINDKVRFSVKAIANSLLMEAAELSLC